MDCKADRIELTIDFNHPLFLFDLLLRSQW